MHLLPAPACLLLLSLCPAQATLPYPFRPEAFPRYELEVRLDPARRRLEGLASMWVPAAATPRDTIRLGLGKNMRNLVAEVVAPPACAGPLQLEPDAPIAANATWRGRPVAPFPAGQPVQLSLRWEGGEETSFVHHLGDEGSFLSGANTAWYPVLENGLGTGSLRVDVPAGWSVHATGLQRGSDAERARGTFRYECAVPAFFALAAGKYSVTRHEGAVPVSVYLLRPRPDVEACVDGCRKCIEVLAAEFGPYPSGEFAVVEVPEARAKEAGFTGASVAGFIMVTRSFVDTPFNLAYYGHEIGHQWWGNLVRRQGTRGRMMIDEAMAQYGSLRVVETLEGEAAAESYRRTGYRGYYADQSGFGYLRLAGTGRDYPLDNLPPQASRTLSDGKGFLVWDMLAETLGRDDFRRVLREFTARHAFQRATWEDLLQAIQDGAAGRDLQWFFAQWFRRTGAPEWHLTWRQDGGTVLGTITQAEPFYRATLEVQAAGDDGQTHSGLVEVDGPTTEFTLPLVFTATSVVLDPRFRVLRWTPEYRAAVAQEAGARAPDAAEKALLGEAERLLGAVVRADRDAMRAQLADDFVQTDVRDWSRPLGTDAWIDNAVRILGRMQTPEAKLEQASVRVRGQTGIVQAMLVLRGRTDAGPREARFVLIDVWSIDSGAWRLVARHIDKADGG